MTMLAVSSIISDNRSISRKLTVLLAAACGLIAANVYYAQPLVDPIGRALGLSPPMTGLIVTLTQVGYGVGLLLIVPLGDLIENRRLVLSLIGVTSVALSCAAWSTHPLSFLSSALFIGLGSVAVQVLVAYAAHMAPEAERGKVVGNVTSGLMVGIMLARPISSFIAGLSSWRNVFFLSAGLMLILAIGLTATLPRRAPEAKLKYRALLASMGSLALATPVLQRRAFYQACLYGAFSLFWTTMPLLLVGPGFRLSQKGVALFALLGGGGGVVAAPLIGRIADRGSSRIATGCSILAVAGAFPLTKVAPENSTLALCLMVVAAILLDFGMTANLIVGQRAIFSIGAEYRSRLNGLFIATFFIGGAVGSALGGWAYAKGGWTLTTYIGFALPVSALLWFATEWRRPQGVTPACPPEEPDILGVGDQSLLRSGVASLPGAVAQSD
jgi:predicted MFS family arabinose efflux permease